LDEIFQLINIKLSKYLQHYFFFFLGFFFWEHDDTFLWQKVGNNEIMKGTWLLRRPIRFSNLVKTSVEGTWEKRVSQMMRAWREKNKLVSQMGLQFSNVCIKKRLLIRGAIFSKYLPRIFLLEKKKLSQLVLLCCSSGNFERKFFLFMAKLFRFFLFVGGMEKTFRLAH